jgi:hypothetical protein
MASSKSHKKSPSCWGLIIVKPSGFWKTDKLLFPKDAAGSADLTKVFVC